MHSPPSAQMQRNLSTRRLGRSVAIPTSQSRSFACLSAAAAMGTARSLSKKQMETGLVHDLAPLHRDAIHTAAATGAGLAGEEGAHTPTTDNESDSDFRAFGGGVQRPLTASESMPLLCAADGTLGVVGSGRDFVAQNFVSSQHLYHSAAACCLFSDMRPSSALGPTGPWPSLPSAERDSLSILPERACGGGSNLSLCTSDLSCLSEGLSNDSTARVPDVMDEWHTGTSHVAFSK